MPRPLRLDLRLLLLLVFGALAAACSPKIGDSCTTSTDCSATGDRLCDITEPGGYCTIFNCEPGGCPEDSVCVNFGSEPSIVPGCMTGQGSSPYQRAFCMASCDSNSDCRRGYSCLPLDGANRWSAVVVDTNVSNKVCLANEPTSPPPVNANANANEKPNENGVCLGSDAGPSGAGGTSGAGGEAGASAMGEAGVSGATN